MCGRVTLPARPVKPTAAGSTRCLGEHGADGCFILLGVGGEVAVPCEI